MTQTATNDANAGALFQSTAAKFGINVRNLGQLAQVQLVLASIMTDEPPGAVVAGDISSGTFGSGVPDTGTFVFPTQVGFGTTVISTTALATPAAVVATTAQFFASTVSGATLMGFGTSADVTLKNQAGTDVLTVTQNSTGLVAAGTLSVGGALTLLAGALASSPSLGIGYKTGAGGVVTQASTRATVVTLNTTVGQITGNATSLAASTSATFTVINTTVAATDLILLSVVSGPTANTTIFSIASVAAGLFTIRAENIATVTGDVGAPVLNFAVIKGAIS